MCAIGEQWHACNRHGRSGVVLPMEDPDDPARQDECARRLLAYAAELRAKQQRQSNESGTYDDHRNDGQDGRDWPRN